MPAYGRKKCLQFCQPILFFIFLQGCRTRLHTMVQYAESMEKLVENAVFLLMCPQEQQEQQQSKT
jgi:hypothetical protein